MDGILDQELDISPIMDDIFYVRTGLHARNIVRFIHGQALNHERRQTAVDSIPKVFFRNF